MKHFRSSHLPLTRREFLRGAGGLGFLAFSGAAPAFLAQSALAQTPKAERDRTILVIIQLAGGNDGLNTVIPFSDDNYYNLRPNLGIKDSTLKLNNDLAFHPACSELHELFNEGSLSILQNVGYPNPNRSHFRSTEIWETGSQSDDLAYSGWLGRYFDNTCSGSAEGDYPHGIHIGNIMPQSFLSEKSHSIFGMRARGSFNRGKDPADLAYEKLLEANHLEGSASYLQHTMMNTLVTERRVERLISRYKTPIRYPGTNLGQSLRRIAALIHADLETRVYFVSQGGYDTHANQLNNHARLLGDLSKCMSAFQKDLDHHKKSEQVMTMTFSEFGRRPSENGSSGTDHGTAAPLFVMGSATSGGLIGNSPDLNVDANEDLTYGTDFRSIYATLLDKWFDADADTILGKKHERIGFI